MGARRRLSDEFLRRKLVIGLAPIENIRNAPHGKFASLAGAEGSALSIQTSILNSAPSSVLAAVNSPPIFFSMIIFDMESPIPVPFPSFLVE